MTKYTYRGPLSSVSLEDGKTVALIDGGTVELPEEHEHVVSLVGRKHLTELKLEAPRPKSTAPTPPTANTSTTNAPADTSSPGDASPPSKRGQKGAR